MLRRVAFVVVCLGLTACGSGLADRAVFQGEVAVRIGTRELEGRLTWARPTGAADGTLQFDVTRDGHADNVTVAPPGRVVAFRDGVPRPAAADELRLVAALAAILGWPTPIGGLEAAERVAGRDAARFADGAEAVITIRSERPPGPHGR